MKAEQVLKLIESGFNADEVRAMMNDTNTEPETKPEPEPTPEPETITEPNPEPDMLAFIAGEFKKLNDNLTAANIIRSEMEAPHNKKGEEILAEVIAPPRK